MAESFSIAGFIAGAVYQFSGVVEFLFPEGTAASHQQALEFSPVFFGVVHLGNTIENRARCSFDREQEMLDQNLIKKILDEDSFTREEKARLEEIFHFSEEAQRELAAIGNKISESKLMEILHITPEIQAELRIILRGTKGTENGRS